MSLPRRWPVTVAVAPPILAFVQARRRFPWRGKTGESQSRQRRRAGKPRARGGIGVDEHAVGAESCNGVIAVGEQPPHPLAERQCRAGGFAGYDEHPGAAIVENDTRADAGQRAAETGAESAQAFEPFLRARWQRRAETNDLSGRDVVRLEAARAECADARRAEDRRADRIGPENARSVGAPQPYRPGAGRKRPKPRVTQRSELWIDDRHAAELVTLKEFLIKRAAFRVSITRIACRPGLAG